MYAWSKSTTVVPAWSSSRSRRAASSSCEIPVACTERDDTDALEPERGAHARGGGRVAELGGDAGQLLGGAQERVVRECGEAGRDHARVRRDVERIDSVSVAAVVLVPHNEDGGVPRLVR